MPLSKYGYHDIKQKTELARHRALLKALREGESGIRIFRKLARLSTIYKYKDPKLSTKFKRDRDWIRKHI